MKHTKINNFLKKNSPTILTIVSSVGVVITAVMSAKNTVRAMRDIKIAQDVNNLDSVEEKPLTIKQKINIAAPCYVPTIITGAATILCIFSANKLNKNIQKSLTSAYVLLDKSYKEYKKSVKELYGDEGNANVIKNIADKRVDDSELTEQEDTDLFFDFFGLQFFKSKLSKVIEAEKAANEMLQMHGYFSLANWYSFVGADMNASDELLGWSLGAGKLYDYDRIKIDITKETNKDGNEYYIIDFIDSPTEDYLEL